MKSLLTTLISTIAVLKYLFIEFLDATGIKRQPFYRFLTEDEMIAAYGYKWPITINGNWSMDMLYLLGKRVPLSIVMGVKLAQKEKAGFANKTRTYRSVIFTKGAPKGVVPSFVFHIDMMKIDPDRKEYHTEHAGFAVIPGNEEVGRKFSEICEKYAEWKKQCRQYRFKTEQEFISEVGEDLNSGIEFGWNEQMSYLFGRPIHTFEAAHLYYSRQSNRRTRLLSFPYPEILIKAKSETLDSSDAMLSKKGLKMLDAVCEELACDFNLFTKPDILLTDRESKKLIKMEHKRRLFSQTIEQLFFSFSGSMIISTELETISFDSATSGIKQHKK